MNPYQTEQQAARVLAVTMGILFVVLFTLKAITF